MFQLLHLFVKTEASRCVRSLRLRYDNRNRFIARRIFSNARRALSTWIAIRIIRSFGIPRAGVGACEREGGLLIAMECGDLRAADRCSSRCSSEQVDCGRVGSASRPGPRRRSFAVDASSNDLTRWQGPLGCSRWVQRVPWC